MIECVTKTIAPEDAKIILEDHNNYRNVSSGRTGAYKNAMERNDWGLSILIFDDDGELADGQTRLSAVIETGIAQKFVVLSGWPKEEIVYIDGGQNRSKGQVLKAERGANNARNASALACGIETITERPRPVLNSESVALYDRYCDLINEFMPLIHGSSFKAAVHIIAFLRASLIHPERKEDIKTALNNIKNLNFTEEKMSGLKLYYRWAVEKGFQRGGSNGRRETYLRCARALQAYLNDEPLQKLYLPSEDPFPYKYK